MLKQFIIILVALVMSTALFGCASEDYEKDVKSLQETESLPKLTTEKEKQQMIKAVEIPKLANNTELADNLIKTTYPEETLLHLDTRIDHIFEKTPPECARLTNGKVYFVFRSNDRHYLFLLYSFDKNPVYPIDRWYCKNDISSGDFERIAKGKTTLSDVQKLDPYGLYDSLYASSVTKLCSVHHTIDGFKICVDYVTKENEVISVENVTKFSGEDNLVYFSMLPIDKELVNAK